MGSGMKVILGIIIAIFIISIPVVFGVRRGMGPTGPVETEGLKQTVAMVNGQPISRGTFLTTFALAFQFQGEAGADVRSLEMMRASILNSLVEQQVLVQAAQGRGIGVGRGDVRGEIRQRMDAELAAYQKQFGKRADVAEARSRLTAKYRDEEALIRNQLIVARLQQAIQNQVKVSDQDLLDSYDEAKARHILIATRKPGGGKPLSEEEARKKAELALAELKGGANFAELAKRESDDPGSASQGGDLGWFRRGRMVPEFDKAAFTLKPGETSGLVKTSYGYHVIQVEDRRRQLPKDFEKNKKKLRDDLLKQRQAQAWQAFGQDAREKAKISISDPELRGALAYAEQNYDQALKDFQTALQHPDRLGEGIQGALDFTMGQIYMTRREYRKAAEALEKAMDHATSEMLPIYLQLGEAYLKLGNKEQAAKYYVLAAEESPEDSYSLMQLQTAFTQLGDAKRAAEMAKLKAEAERKQREEMAAPTAPIRVPPGR